MECLLYETERKKRTDCDSRHGCLLRCTVDRRSLYSYDPIRQIWQNHCLSVKGLICISILVCGPSGVGKTTLIKKLMQNYPDRFGFCVSHTTRPKRKGERNGIDYHFTTPEIIQKEIQQGNFIEHAVVHGNIYGTSFLSVEDVIRNNRICILDIDVQGVQNILKRVADATTILILPPSIEELSSRLHKRNTENEETIQLRLKNSVTEMEKASHIPFTKVIVNKDINESYQELEQSISHFLDSFVYCIKFKTKMYIYIYIYIYI
ncbi:uncharacterized protein [Blastocystis hominis]|uniref:guanylate kinase n=1 Tax=Blastocystis hominis TaxID=12968 RepID=D8M3L2_BLAHO|nr:uncharacterized protein [Blastocystis hominis]CBK22485.2 unnamed protein product [Blastocystis hominis]|eukprot:XP_012896533.1 uncharacterized protein [Blastocystis hominis]